MLTYNNVSYVVTINTVRTLLIKRNSINVVDGIYPEHVSMSRTIFQILFISCCMQHHHFNLSHAWMHFKCMVYTTYNYLFKKKYRTTYRQHMQFYFKGIFRSLGII